MNNPCTPPCPPEEQDWIIPGGILNILWKDVFPRLVAAAWSDGVDLIGEIMGPGDPVGNLVARINAVPDSGNQLYINRRDKLLVYLGVPNKRIPINWVAGGGYDFLLSDKGLDLFVPDEPTSVRDLIHYYTFRRTGRPAIGTPFYAPGVSAVEIDSPTGPSQIQLRLDTLHSFLQASGASEECLAIIWRSVQMRGIPDPHNSEVVRLDLDTYKCVMGPLRCWQIEGAVYRGMMTELPRLVSEIWVEYLDEIVASVQECYARRWASGPDGRREIFQQRLETTLPDTKHMKWETYAPPTPLPPPPPATPWDSGDVIITNQGFFFPEIKPLHDPTGTTAGMYGNKNAALTAVLNEIKGGKAGNPVFTDSQRTEGRGD